MSNIKITHKSIGMTNEEWEKNRKQFVEKVHLSTTNRTNPTNTFRE